jgi:outer membrane protein OmpA-like peptidoglycan-associated protein
VRRRRLVIALPCSEDWNAMTRVQGGRACDACGKRVVDLSGKSEREAQALFDASAGELCGRLRVDALGEAIWRAERAPPSRAMIVAASLVLPLAACGGADRTALVATGPTAPLRTSPPTPVPAPHPPRSTAFADSDEDGILDAVDGCPHEPGIASAEPARNGCRQFLGIIVSASKLEIRERIPFAVGSWRTAPSAAPVLAAIAEAMKRNPEICRLRVLGHAGGDESDRKRLSVRRAEAVLEQLARLGVARERLEALGAGDERPRVPNDSAEHRGENRRVEFEVLSDGECPPGGSP